MRKISQSMLAIGAMLILSSPAEAQSNSTLRLSTDHSVTTRPVGPGNAHHFWDTPGLDEKSAPENSGEMAETAKAPAVKTTPEAPPEDPRTMITRDRIESPQHR